MFVKMVYYIYISNILKVVKVINENARKHLRNVLSDSKMESLQLINILDRYRSIGGLECL